MPTIRLLFFLLLAFQVRVPGPGGESAGTGAPCTPANGYGYCRILTINPSQVGGSNLSNFGVLVAATLGPSRIQNSNCNDVIFTSDSAGTTRVPWEQEACTPSTGAIMDWVGLSSISASANTLFYVSYGNPAISTAQNTGSYAPSNVWDSNYTLIQHLGNGTTLSVADSTGNVSAVNDGATAATGQIDGGASLNGSSQYIDDPMIIGYSALTVEAWVYITGSTGSNGRFVANSHTDSDNNGFQFANYYGDLLWFDVGNGTANSGQVFSPGIATNTWTHGVATYNGSTVNVYANGVSGTAASFTGPIHVSGYDVNVGRNSAYGGDYFGPYVDEVRISNISRASNWIIAEYNNQKPSSTFLTVGIEY